MKWSILKDLRIVRRIRTGLIAVLVICALQVHRLGAALTIGVFIALCVVEFGFCKCPHCGRGLGWDDGAYCQHCGKKLDL